MSHGIPILSVASIEGIFHQAFVLRATKYRMYTMTDLARQNLVSSCFFNQAEPCNLLLFPLCALEPASDKHTWM